MLQITESLYIWGLTSGIHRVHPAHQHTSQARAMHCSASALFLFAPILHLGTKRKLWYAPPPPLSWNGPISKQREG